MSDKKNKKFTYAMTVSGTEKHVNEASKNFYRAKMLMEMYSCSEYSLKYRDNAISILAEYMTNMRFYEEFMQDQLLSDNRIKDKKTGQETIIVPMEEFMIINSYLVTTAACENDLEALGISMRLH